jgi:hypothetical protein
MRAAAFETIVPNGPITALPLSLEQTASRSSPLLLFALALPAAVAALTPFFLIAHHASQDASLLLDRQETSVFLAFALVMWALLFGWPIAGRAIRFGLRRQVEISGHRITVTDTGLFHTGSWSQPVSSYRGLAHHVRASLSGNRHELILIHPDPAHCVLLRTADRIGQSEIDDLARLLGCREIAPQVFYHSQTGRRHPVGRNPVAEAALTPTTPELAAAG